jgi:hypothetical protein
MFALAIALGLAPGQAGQLELTNVRPTYGILGAPRPTNDVLPGDVFWLAFDMQNVKLTPTGKVEYSMGFEVLNSKGTPQIKEEEKDRTLLADTTLGGNRLPIFARADVGLDTPPGEYTMKVTVTDRTAKTSKVLERKFKVLPLTFGLVRLSTSYDQRGDLPAPMFGVPGQFLHVNFVAVGFERDKAKKQPNLQVELNVLDDKNKPVLAKPDTGTVNEKNSVPENARGLPMVFVMALNRPGKFTVELKATDLVSKKTAKLNFPLTILANDK